MHVDPYHWWSTHIAIEDGQRYGFRLDGSVPIADPMSRWQPDGVHGLSAYFDATRFNWTDAAFRPRAWADAVVYEMHIGTFSAEGTLDAAIEKFPYLADLGVSHLEIMPVADFPGTRGWGYDGVHLFATHQAYGGPHALQRFVDAAHHHGLAVLLDVVYNHLGPKGAVLHRFGPYSRGQTPWGPALDFHYASDHPIRRYAIENASMWMRDFHIDGLRLDAVQVIEDHSDEHILRQLARETRALETYNGVPPVLVAETPLNDPILLRTIETGGYGIHAQWNDDFHHALQAFLTEEQYGYYQDYAQPEALLQVLQTPYWFDGTRYSSYWGRVYGAMHSALSGHHLVAYAQSHDQVGNRPDGQRLSALTSLSKTKIAAALLLTSPYVPMLWQGEEWGSKAPFFYFVDHDDPGLADRVHHSRKQEFRQFGWPQPLEDVPHPQHHATFESSKLDWPSLARPEGIAMHHWYRDLLLLRRETTRAHDFRQDVVELRDGILWIRRGPLSLAVNPTASSTSVDVPTNTECRLHSAYSVDPTASTHRCSLPPWSVAIFVSPDQGESSSNNTSHI